jgi:uncharacterized protein involved in outer membrane biogenesis
MPHFNQLGRTARILLLLVGLLVVALIICEALGWPFLRAPAEHFMSQQLDRTVRLTAPFRLHLLGGIRLSADGLWISSPQQFDAPHLVDAKKVALSLRYSDLLNRDASEPMRIKSLLVDKLDAYLIRDKEGNATWQFHKTSKTPSPFPHIETLVVREGTAKVGDEVTQADLQLQFSTKEGADSAKPLSKLHAEGKFREHPAKGELTTDGFLPIVTQKANAPPIASKGWVDYSGVHLDFDGQVSDLFGNRKVNGKFAATGPSLGIIGDFFNIALPTTKDFKLNGDIKKENDLLHVTIDSAHVGASDLSADFKYDTSKEVSKLSGDLHSKHFVLADLLPALGGVTGDDSAAAERRAKGLLIPNRPLDLYSLHRMDADIRIDMEYVDLGKYFSEPITPFKANLSLGSAKLSLAKIYARTADGTLAGTVSVDAQNFKQKVAEQEHIKPADLPTWKIDLNWKDINLAKWLQVSKERKAKARQEGKEAPVPYLTGTLNGKTNLSGKGRSTADLIASLDGNIAMYINHGSISHLVVEAFGLDIAQGLGLLVKGDEPLPLTCALMDFKATNGIAKPEVALINTPVTLILTDGNINMGKEKLDLRFIAKPKNKSPFTVRSPILVTGTFAKPKVTVEATPIAARVLGGIALAFINPLASILPFLDPGSESHASCGQALAEFNSKTNVKPAATATAKSR